MGRRTTWLVALLAVAATLGLAAPAGADAQGLRAGVGRADVTPPTGYFLFGWVRSDARASGQLTRLFARAMVLESGGEKVALVSVDLGAVPAGLVADAAERVADRGFSESNVLVSASHTHSAPSGYFNYPAFNTVAPTDTTPTTFELAPPADEELYTFLATRIAAAIRRADDDLAPAEAGWGSSDLLGLTENRSIEAHLANHGIILPFGEGSVADDPLGYEHTIDPHVSVLRVDKVAGSDRVPIGMWSTFADHGTVVKPTFAYYNADHHAAAARVAEDRIREIGDVPAEQEVINSYGNSDEGDITAGLEHSGPAGAEEVGREEARAMVKAWRAAGASLDGDPPLALRWTRACFCGRATSAGPVDDRAVVGLPFLTGSEENRGPLYDETGVPFEGQHLPTEVPPQGNKIQTVQDTGQFPTAVPLAALQVGDRAIVTVPGEMSSGMGRRLREATLDAAAGSGIEEVVVSGLASDFIQYLTTPEEYGQQHYEGGSTLFGPASGVFVEERLADLVARIAAGQPAPAPDAFDPRNGVVDDAAPFGPGAAQGTPVDQPREAARLGHPIFTWLGGERGLDRPLDRAFVTIERRVGGDWVHADDDLGMRILWTVNRDGRYTAKWEPPLDAPLGEYRFAVDANLYDVTSDPFTLRHASDLKAELIESGGGRAVLELRNPVAVENFDLTWRPRRAQIAEVLARPHGGEVAVQLRGHQAVITGDPGTTVVVPRLAMRDPDGNRNRNRLEFEL